MAKPRPSMMKRQREQAKRDKKAAKLERRAQRKSEHSSDADHPQGQPSDPQYVSAPSAPAEERPATAGPSPDRR